MTRKHTDERLIEMFEEDCRFRGLAEGTTKGYIGNIQSYMEYLHTKHRRLLDIDKQILKEFIGYLRSGRNYKRKTLGNVFSSLNTFYDFLVYEEITDANIIGPFRKRFLSNYKEDQFERKIPEIEVMTRFVNSIPKVRDKAIVLTLAKTGIRRNELITLDVNDIDWTEQSIKLKPTRKRSNRIVFFDAECSRILKRWIHVRETLTPQTEALFIGEDGNRLKRHGVYDAVVKWAEMFGLHDNGSDSQDRLVAHSLRHWFTTILRRNGMRREFIQELRGDIKTAAIDIYDHIDKKELRQAYLVAMPELGIV